MSNLIAHPESVAFLKSIVDEQREIIGDQAKEIEELKVLLSLCVDGYWKTGDETWDRFMEVLQ